MRRLALALAPLTLSLLPMLALTACGERSEPTGNTTRLFPVTVAGADGSEATVRTSANRVAVLGEATERVVVALGREPIQVANAAGVLDPQALVAAEPDLVVVDSADRSLADDLRNDGTPVYVMPDRSLADIEKALVDVSLLLGEPLAGRAAAQKIATARSRLERRLASSSEATVFFDRGKFATVADASFIGSLLREAKARNIAGPAPNEGPFDLGQLIRAQPQVYLTTSTSGHSLADLRKHRRLKRLAAIKEGRFFVIPTEDLAPGPGAVRGLELIARALHPDAFS